MLTLRPVLIHGQRRWRVDSNLDRRRVRKVYRASADAATLCPGSGREVPVSQLTVVDVETWLGENARTAGSRATMINRLSTLFAFLKRRRLIRENPCEFIDRPTIEQGPPTIRWLMCVVGLPVPLVGSGRPWW